MLKADESRGLTPEYEFSLIEQDLEVPAGKVIDESIEPEAVLESEVSLAESMENPIQPDSKQSADDSGITSKLHSIEKPLYDFVEKQIESKLEPVLSAINGLADEIEGLSKLFDTKISRTEREEKVIDNMHSELSQYRQDMYARLTRPLLQEIAEARDYAMKLVSEAQTTEDGTAVVDAYLIEVLMEQLLEAMVRNGGDAYQTEPMSHFDPAKMRIVKKIPTADESLHGKVLRSVSNGYLYDGKRMIPERVWVYAFTPE